MNSLLSLGYEGLAIGEAIECLTAAGVEVVADVRAIAQSRKPGFSKRLLAGALAEAGIGYVHLRGLGTPKVGRDAIRRGDVGTMQRIYATHLDTPEAVADLGQLRALSGRVCLLCFERDPHHCHRTLVAEALGRSAMPVRRR